MANETWIIDPFVIVYNSATPESVAANFDDCVLTNFGTVFNRIEWAVYFSGDDGVINNQQGALIKGDGVAIFTGSGGANLDVNNRGAIVGNTEHGIRALGQADDVTFDNFSSGVIQGFMSGIFLENTGTSINNSGTIRGLNQAGVFFTDSAEGTMTVDNSGQIFGDLAGIAIGIRISMASSSSVAPVSRPSSTMIPERRSRAMPPPYLRLPVSAARWC
jgi:hypothetical protein